MSQMELGWQIFPMVAIGAMVLSAAGAVAAWCRCKRVAVIASLGAVLLFTTFIVHLWILLERPPLRTMGETRLWYSFFLAVAGFFTYLRGDFRWILSFSTILGSVFLLINILRPEIHDQTLMPALQSLWFVPHVSVYMFSYALLGCATLMALYGLIRPQANLWGGIRPLLSGGLALFTVGMLIGALWAKEAWGLYWSWDAKEAWAVATWGLYLLVFHGAGLGQKARLLLLIVAFLALQMCWYGVNYLPTARESAHTYNRS